MSSAYMASIVLGIVEMSFTYILKSVGSRRGSKKSLRISMALRTAKKALRLQLKQKLKSMSDADKHRQSQLVTTKLFQNKRYLNSQRISVYLSRDIEVDTRPILENIFSSGKECFIPRYDSKSTHMVMLKLKSLEEYEKMPLTTWNIKQPDAEDDDRENALLTGGLDLIIVPGIGFTKEGHRIGNGKGYYDVYIKKCQEILGTKVSTIALAFQEQIVPYIPTDEHDMMIDEVLYPEEAV
ncbi:5-formyltetrahydrofolate cyclo-ligase-like isoform X2 [Stegodyphus dumicola]|uniref:5-formyltetrahydrofolate cyclo-ligase-like isoform X2 n=1 Tax=Stegodyphus dumicola TaxID=202533 RepID=UPI0015ABDD4B|nr:5-formyltetrahydrofolate cyclo-ligase-like isoform X2 [Stegodyphus dumicola]